MDARRNPSSRRSDPDARAAETERQPFLDLSNFNLTPIETLRKLCFSAPSSAGTSSNFPGALSKSPILGSKSDSKSSQPRNDNSTDAKSDTSVGSSSFVQAGNANRFGISTTVRVHPSPTSTAHVQRATTRKSNRETKATVLPCSSTLLENKKGKGEVVAKPVTCLPPRSNKEKENVTSKPLNCPHPENKKDESEQVDKLARSLLSDGNKGKGKGIVDTVSLLPAKNKKDRGKESFESLSSSPPKYNKDTGNSISSISSSCEDKNKGNDNVEQIHQLSTEKKKNKGKESFESLSSPPLKSKDRGNIIVNIGSSCEKTMGKEISDASLKSPPPQKTRGKRKADTFVFSCPPLPKTRNSRNKCNEVGDVELPGSKTVPNAKQTKCANNRISLQKRRSEDKYRLPEEFVAEKKAYFKEIDDFELLEEEASD
nr:probable serine/threonine-protein kinase DDB_G0272282 isoform X2 [Ipomoea batatas]GMC98372.1 probable serine/threonine-protein kinase DDB_G0272282 isoform X2 [Ipomoea batatas]